MKKRRRKSPCEFFVYDLACIRQQSGYDLLFRIANYDEDRVIDFSSGSYYVYTLYQLSIQQVEFAALNINFFWEQVGVFLYV